ncbi:hypothetical protein PTTW11_07621 [Pyrenophora teres f. teres]|uniref:DUF7730 domain-containing protein n=1 Tax=Pyrenophora teres f. teres TaxID=97479 RepID=A0A6S6W7N5_9PLEO|nr:hypothetical protein PTTW11_07621 [Pyrenophora teres f. teres]
MGTDRASHHRAILQELLGRRTQRNTLDSPLLRLPGEIRNKIYDYALIGETVSVRYFHLKDLLQVKRWYDYIDVFGLFAQPSDVRSCWHEDIVPHERKGLGALALLFTCSQIRNEFLVPFYSRAVFDFSDFEFRSGWRCIRSHIGHSNCRLIQSIKLDGRWADWLGFMHHDYPVLTDEDYLSSMRQIEIPKSSLIWWDSEEGHEVIRKALRQWSGKPDLVVKFVT